MLGFFGLEDSRFAWLVEGEPTKEVEAGKQVEEDVSQHYVQLLPLAFALARPYGNPDHNCDSI